MFSCLQKKQIFEVLLQNLSHQFTPEIWKQLHTKNGQTQSAESISKQFVRTSLNDMISRSLITHYTEAPSQKHGDFIIYHDVDGQDVDGQDVDGTNDDSITMIPTVRQKIILECKKTDSKNIMCNDTLPSQSTDYLIFYTASKCIKDKPQILLINGGYIITPEDQNWIKEYQNTIEQLKILSKTNAKNNIKAYPRPNWSFDITRFIT